MLKLNAEAFIGALTAISSANEIAKADPAWPYQDQGRRDYFLSMMDRLLGELRVLDLRLAIKKAENIKWLVATDENVAPPKVSHLAALVSQKFSELQERIEQELADRFIYSIEPQRAALLESAESPFGDDVADTFECAYDISEAAYCLALSRNTAAVFHLMRAMEAAVLKLGHKLQVTIVDKNNVELEWGKIIANLKAPVEAMPRGDLRDSWSEAITLLYHVKQTWRNNTMHPKTSYTDDEAKRVYDAAKSFMTCLAPLI